MCVSHGIARRWSRYETIGALALALGKCAWSQRLLRVVRMLRVGACREPWRRLGDSWMEKLVPEKTTGTELVSSVLSQCCAFVDRLRSSDRKLFFHPKPLLRGGAAAVVLQAALLCPPHEPAQRRRERGAGPRLPNPPSIPLPYLPRTHCRRVSSSSEVQIDVTRARPAPLLCSEPPEREFEFP